MGTTPSDTWFDSDGKATFWRNIPLKTVKKALFRKGEMIRSLTTMVLNGVTYDFNKTAESGVVIVPPNYSAIEFISPDGRVDFNELLSKNLGDSFTDIIGVLEGNPIPAWDRFAVWFGNQTMILSVIKACKSCELVSFDGQFSTVISKPAIENVTDMASILNAMKTATEVAHDQPIARYQMDNSVFGWILRITNSSSVTDVGFIFRE